MNIRIILSIIWALLGLSLTGRTLAGAEEQAEYTRPTAEQIRQHVKDLDHRELARRNAAEAALLSLGPEGLAALPEITPTVTGEVRQRLLRIRDQLQRQGAAQSLEGSRVTLQGNFVLTEALQMIEKETSNRFLDYRPKFGQPITDPNLVADWKQTPFWPAIDELLDQAGLTIYNYAGERHALALVHRPTTERPRRARGTYTGLFRLEPLRVLATRELRDPSQDKYQLDIELLWEPRITPALIRHATQHVQIEYGDGPAIPINDGTTHDIPVQATISGVEVPLLLPPPPPAVKAIKTLRGRMIALVPGPATSFEFQDLTLEQESSQRHGGMTVTLVPARKNDGFYEFPIRVQLDEETGSFASHLHWITDNQIELIDPQGKVQRDPNFERFLERENELGLVFLFPAAGDLRGYRLIYKTPVALLPVEINYELKDIRLP